ncbi:MAG: hypothetical protein JXA97_14375 [Anaerolineales bacterium]|nr:hypothetical protein [Anaerolineales bacterium]
MARLLDPLSAILSIPSGYHVSIPVRWPGRILVEQRPVTNIIHRKGVTLVADVKSKIKSKTKKKRPSKGQRTHARRLKQDARKTGPIHN